MIKSLSIQNLVLVETCILTFCENLNVITGETGSGKTALTEGISLCLGKRASSDLIRKGCDKGISEMVVASNQQVDSLLSDAGIDSGDELVIRREISKEGKSRAWINSKPVPLPLLQEIGSLLIDQISQHSHQEIRSFEEQRHLLDLFSDAKDDLFRFQRSYSETRELQKKQEEAVGSLSEKERKEELLQFQLDEILSAHIREEEEDELFNQYKKLSSAKERLETVHTLLQICEKGPSSLLSQLHKLIRATSEITSSDEKSKEVMQLWQEALIPLQEGARMLEAFCSEDRPDPKQLAKVEERLSLLQTLKRKYGSTVVEIFAYQKKVQQQLDRFAALEDALEEIQGNLLKKQKETELLAETLSQKRKEGACRFGALLTQELQALNMSKAIIDIELVNMARTASGDEEVRFWLQANPGEKAALVKEHASGGELCRLLFVIKVALSEKNQTSTLIFDEVDAHVGGKTATLMGQELKRLGEKKQVLCITHFPQVASFAQAHIQVLKSESVEGRTLTQIKRLTSKEEMKRELARMSGN